jgi:hypothetical protein
MSKEYLPFWVECDADEIAEYCDEIQAEHELTISERNYLFRQMTMQSYRWEKGGKIGSSVSKKALSKLNSERQKRYEKTKKAHPVHILCMEAENFVVECLWKIGCLEIDFGRWIWTTRSLRTHGENWHAVQISKAAKDLRQAVKKKDLGTIAQGSFDLGQLVESLKINVRHGPFLEKQWQILERQKTVGRRPKGLKSDRIARVRYYMEQGLLPTAAAEAAADDLGVSLTTVRKAFPDEWLPRDLHDFPAPD